MTSGMLITSLDLPKMKTVRY